MKLFLQTATILVVMSGLSTANGQAPKFDVLTHHNDIYRSGVYSGETRLQPNIVNARNFGKAFVRRVLGQIWGQPLYVRGVPVRGQPRNVVYVATSENMVYGFDADDRRLDEATEPLMSISLGAPQKIGDEPFHTILPSNGITSGPVIDLGDPSDPSKGTLYVVARLGRESSELLGKDCPRDGAQDRDGKFHIFALDLRSLAIRPDSAGQRTGVVVCATVPGQGSTRISFAESDHLNRPALLITKNRLVIAFGSGPKGDLDCARYHGWVMSYSLPNLIQTGAYITTPSAATGMGGIWQSGNGPAADDQGNIYFVTGNGHFQSKSGLLPDLADAFVKLDNANGALRLSDWYSPPSREVLAACDIDLGSSGPAVIQDAGKVLGAGKSGVLYVLNKDNMGRTEHALSDADAWRGAPDCRIGQCFRVAENQFEPPTKTKLTCDMGASADDCTGFRGDNWNEVVDSYPHVHGGPVVWGMGSKKYNLYLWPEQDFLKAYRFDGRTFSSNPIGSSAPMAAARQSMPGALLSLSWDGSNASSGLLWTARPDPDARELAVGTPFVSVFADQQHFVFRNPDGAVWDSYFRRCDDTWHLQQVNFSGIAAASEPVVSVFGSAGQQHFVYLDSAGGLQDSFQVLGPPVTLPPHCRTNQWSFQQVTTNGHSPVLGLFVSAFHDQQHFSWRDNSGAIWDSFFSQFDNHWHFQSINTHGHPAVSGPFVSVFDSADQQHFAYTDGLGNIWDSFYRRGDNKWLFQQIDTKGHAPVGRMFISAFHDQQHFSWRDEAGSIWDAFFSQFDNKWHFQAINAHGHPAVTGPFVSVFGSADQQHFVYTDRFGNIWDSFYRRGDNQWLFQQIGTGGHPAVGGIFVSAFFDQQHFAWSDGLGAIWDAFFSQADNHWHFQQIDTALNCMSATGSDLTPNDAPCNAINKIVRGYLQAFDATPRVGGKLVEVWNSKAEGGGGVWFAKQSPPTIADGKVFLVGFPPPIPGQTDGWSDHQAFGQLVVYSLR